jgi:hypothetical protein
MRKNTLSLEQMSKINGGASCFWASINLVATCIGGVTNPAAAYYAAKAGVSWVDACSYTGPASNNPLEQKGGSAGYDASRWCQ